MGSKQTYDEAWSYLAKYRLVFETTAFQQVLVGLNSHWDWYIRKLADFILFARTDASTPLSPAQTKALGRISGMPLLEQMDVLEGSTCNRLSFSDHERVELYEMSLVRNLGLHNRWEIDDKYLTRTTRQGHQLGTLRLVEYRELYMWHSLLLRLVNETSSAVARAFRRASAYPLAT